MVKYTTYPLSVSPDLCSAAVDIPSVCHGSLPAAESEHPG